MRHSRRPLRRRRFSRGRAAATRSEEQLGRPLPAGDEDQEWAPLRRRPVRAWPRAAPALARRAIADLRAARAAAGQRLEVGPAPRLRPPARRAGGGRSRTRPPAISCASSTRRLPIRSGIAWASYGNLIARPAPRGAGGNPCRARRRPAAGRRHRGLSPLRGVPAGGRPARGALPATARARSAPIATISRCAARPSPALQPEVRRVREELEAVERESADR